MKLHICIQELKNDQLTLMSMRLADELSKSGIDPIFLIENKSNSKFIGDFAFFDFADYYQKSGKYLLTHVNHYKLLKSFPKPTEKYFFVNNFPTVNNNDDMDLLRSINNDNSVSFGFMNESHRDMYHYCWNNVNNQIVGDLNTEQVKQWILNKY